MFVFFQPTICRDMIASWCSCFPRHPGDVATINWPKFVNAATCGWCFLPFINSHWTCREVIGAYTERAWLYVKLLCSMRAYHRQNTTEVKYSSFVCCWTSSWIPQTCPIIHLWLYTAPCSSPLFIPTLTQPDDLAGTLLFTSITAHTSVLPYQMPLCR